MRILHLGTVGTLAFAWLLAGCDGGRTVGDGGPTVDGSVDAGPSLAAPPMIDWLAADAPPVALPEITCPAGWRTVTQDAFSTCAPYPDSGMADCPAGQAHFVGEAGCAPVGAACPAGDFPADVPASARMIYVRAGATGGDGSMSAPYGTLAAVSFATLAAGTTVVLAKGSYSGNITLRPGVRVIGACAAETIVMGVPGETASVKLAAAGEAAELRDVTLRGGPTRGVEVTGAGASLVLAGVVVEEARQIGLYASTGATLDARRVAVFSTREDSGREYGVGLAVDGGATVTMAQAVFAQNHLVSLLIGESGSNVTANDLTVADTLPQALDGEGGRGIDVQGGAALTIHRGFVGGNRGEGLVVGSSSTMAVVEDLVVSDTTSSTVGAGYCIQVFDGASLDAQRVVTEHCLGAGLLAVGAGTTVTIPDLVVRDSDLDDDGKNGFGLVAQQGARVDGSRLFVARVHSTGVLAIGGGAHVGFDDAMIAEVAPMGDGRDGRGATAQFEAELVFHRAAFRAVTTVGVEADGAGASVVLEDVLVGDVRADGTDAFGMGLLAANGGRVSATRALIDEAGVAGAMSVGVGSDVTLADAVVRDTRAQQSDGTFGHGLHTQDGATLSASRVRVLRSRGVGVLAINGASATLSDVTVEETMPFDCSTGFCSDEPFGYGVAAVSGGLGVERFVVSDANLCGVFVGEGSDLDLRTGEVRGAEIGACVQQDGYDLGRLMNDVSYSDNGQNLEATSLPVPSQIMTL